MSRNREGVQCLSSQGQPGGNSSSRESKLPRVRLLAASGAPDPGPGAGDGRRPWALAAGDGRAGNKWFGGCGRDPTAPTFPARGGRTVRRRRGKRGGKGRCAALGTVCVCGEAPRSASGSALLWVGPHGPPAPLLATAASRRRREGSPAARWPLQRPLGPAARRWPPATSEAPRARTRRAPNVPRLRTPALHAGAAPPRPVQRPAAVGRVFSPSIAPHSPRPSLPSCRRRSSPRSTFPRFLRPPRPPPPRPRLLTLAPSLPPLQPPPARQRLAAHPLHAARRDRSGPGPGPAPTPGSRAEPGRALRA